MNSPQPTGNSPQPTGDGQLHDDVVRAMVEIHREKFEVRINLESAKSAPACDGIYPDCVLLEGGHPKFLIEVDTKEMLTPARIPRWQEVARCAASLGAAFFLVVPIDDVREAMGICESHGCQFKFGVFEILDGKVDLTFQK